ncbi:M15 family metallopeptidase [Demequina pelophila]|uniref:M15 family metallopeptidase n=1 Tax=Demequina pelophila TaxID=1638984 RepID=UPI000783BD82|nr:M15 family metallopeptidase [Demequina pelophila]
MRVSHAPVYRRRRRLAGLGVAVLGGLLGFAGASLWAGADGASAESTAAAEASSTRESSPDPTLAALATEPSATPAADASSPVATPSPAASTEPSPEASSPEASADADGFDMEAYSLTDPASPWVVVNKRRPMEPEDYVPTDLVTIPGMPSGATMRAEAAEALGRMHADAVADGAAFTISTAYRGYDHQSSLYWGYVNRSGQASADTYSARPGHSEHQTGLAADMHDGGACDLLACFGDTAAGRWADAHAWEYGFVIRYAEGKDAITGYEYEPWHLRYVGPELAAEMHARGVWTLEEFFGLEAAPDYQD